MTRCTSWTRFAGVLLALLLVEACRDPSNPDVSLSSPNLAAAADPVRISGVGTIGTDPKTPGNDVRDFDLDVSATLSGRLLYRDFFVVRPDGSVGKLAVSPTDAATRITAFRDGSASCADPTKGVEFDGVGRLNTGGDSDPAGDELLAFTVKACDGGPAGSGADYFAMIVPGHDYARGDPPTSGDIVKSTGSPPPPPPPDSSRGNVTATASTTGSDLDPDGYTVTLDGTDARQLSINGSVTFASVSASSHTVALSGVAGNCTVSGGTTQTVTVAAGGTAPAAFSVSCSAPPPPPPPPENHPPIVNAGPDENVLLGLTYSLHATFGDPDNDGPWSYTIDWGDGASSSGTTSSQGAINASHSYFFSLLSTRTIRVTVTDSHGASGSDTKVVTVIL